MPYCKASSFIYHGQCEGHTRYTTFIAITQYMSLLRAELHDFLVIVKSGWVIWDDEISPIWNMRINYVTASDELAWCIHFLCQDNDARRAYTCLFAMVPYLLPHDQKYPYQCSCNSSSSGPGFSRQDQDELCQCLPLWLNFLLYFLCWSILSMFSCTQPCYKELLKTVLSLRSLDWSL